MIDKFSNAVCVFATVNEGKVLFVAGCGKEASKPVRMQATC
jgi:hypothetical protein